MRIALLALLLAAPVASAWSVRVDAPPEAASGIPLVLHACVAGPPGAGFAWKAHLTVDGRTAGGSPRYGPPRVVPASGEACEALRVEVRDVAGEAALLVRARPEDGGAPATWRGALALRQGEPPPLRVAAVHAAPFPGVTLENAGAAELRLAGLVLAQGTRAWPLPDVALAPGARVFVGERAPPDAAAQVPLAVSPRAGNLTLRHWNVEVDRLAVPRLDPGEVATRDGVRVAGRTDVAAAPLRVAGTLTAFVTPDAGAAPLVGLVNGARREVLLTGYTLTSEDVAAALMRALDRGVDVRILVEGAPVGGVPEDEAALLGALAEAGARVDAMRAGDGMPARYRAVHAKVVVVDGARVLVSTENPHASSYPPRAGAPGTRGYGLVVENATLARLLADVHLADAAPWPDVRPLPRVAPPRAPAVTVGATAGPTLRATGAWHVTPILSPDDPFALLDAMNATRRTLDVAMLLADARWGEDANPFLAGLVAAARRGVHVRVLLDGRADPERSREVADALNAAATREALPLEARVDEPARTLHAKLVLLDGARAYVGSMNWGRASALENREVGLLVDAPEVAAHYAAAFEKDWEKEVPAATREVPGAGGVAAGVLIVVLTRARPRRRGACRRPA